MKKLIIFVCSGNIHRSVIAAECLRNILKEYNMDSNFFVDSYGLQGTLGAAIPQHKHLSLYHDEWKAAYPTLQKLGIDIGNHSFQKITSAVVEKASVIVAMDHEVYTKKENALLQQFPQHKKKIHIISELTSSHEDIIDPSGITDETTHKIVIEEIYLTISNNYETILAWAS